MFKCLVLSWSEHIFDFLHNIFSQCSYEDRVFQKSRNELAFIKMLSCTTSEFKCSVLYILEFEYGGAMRISATNNEQFSVLMRP